MPKYLLSVLIVTLCSALPVVAGSVLAYVDLSSGRGKGYQTTSGEAKTSTEGEDTGRIQDEGSQDEGSQDERSQEKGTEAVCEIKTQERLRILMDEILLGYALSNFFSHHSAPSFFIIYAHDNSEYGKADGRTIREFIRYFEQMKAKTRSDRSQDLEGRAKHNIFDNQSCLLPKRVATDPVDKVLLCHSEVLSNYCADNAGREFMSKLKHTGKDLLDLLYHGNNDDLNTQQVGTDYQQDLKELVENRCYEAGFHHVLTELAFVELRASYDHNSTSIIPVSLRGGSKAIFKDLPYLEKTTHCLNMKHCWGPGRFQQQQKFFLTLLKRIYSGMPHVITFINDHYDTGSANIKDNLNIPIEEFRRHLRWEVSEELRRSLKHGPFEVPKRSLTDYIEPWTKGEATDQRTPDIDMPIEHDKSSSNRIPRWLLVSPDQKQKRILGLLGFPEMRYRIDELHEADSETLAWVETHPSYQKWIHNDSGMLGIRGVPGCGKSTVMKYILTKLQPQNKQTHLHLYFFFWQAGHALQSSRMGFYRALLYQLLRKVPAVGFDYWEMMDKEDRSNAPRILSLDELQTQFLAALTNACEVFRVRIFVDALDEVGHDEARKIVADLRKLNKLANRWKNPLSICYSCRYYPAIIVDNGLQIRVEECNENDIQNYVDKQLYLLEIEEAQRYELRRMILSKASGMFLYAKLIMYRLKQSFDYGYNTRELFEIVEGVPEDLANFYSAILSRALNLELDAEKWQDFIIAIMQYVAVATRPFTITEMRYALASDEMFMITGVESCESSAGFIADNSKMSYLVQKYSGGLLQVVEQEDHEGGTCSVIQPLHQTVAGYIASPNMLRGLKRQDRSLGFSDSEWVGKSHERLARCCYHYIRLEHLRWDGKTNKEILDAPFCDYAVHQWFEHVARAADYGVSQSYMNQRVGPEAGKEARVLLNHWESALGRETLRKRGLTPNPTLIDISHAFKFKV
ncbi:uncharacterized protein K460DRAFT_416781 [Cucurbitaria berberidis CBS 394.84]|uniref:Nephrocystin 3-like N-terminal domain-containing protein n=1 Tax=Cucurbitaria berberidis CBS 394.84 TaxID=1168544 RepID=A0A9P4GHZ9_9PLEO|nr:uncharacterized protein K460DRAFT_416781 [Cucurbitaria berberidis CBS 394.84]KAF1845531.1 hypothetical protein K460DRAFT_416781 [Cucurbitaria berberidis CBS 394.84]